MTLKVMMLPVNGCRHEPVTARQGCVYRLTQISTADLDVNGAMWWRKIPVWLVRRNDDRMASVSSFERLRRVL